MAKYPYQDIKSHTDVLLNRFTPPTVNISDVLSGQQLLDPTHINTITFASSIPPTKIAAGKRIMGKLMKALNITPLQAAALAGNFYAESGFLPSVLQGKHKDGYTLSQAKGIGYGFAQWTSPDRQIKLRNFLNQKYNITTGDKHVMTEDDNIDFIVYELKSSKSSTYNLSTLDKLKTYKSTYIPTTNIGFEDLSNATVHIMTKYERPKDQSITAQKVRVGYAKQLLENY